MLVNFFGNDGLTVSLETIDPRRLEHASPGDNVVYLVRDHKIVVRIAALDIEQSGQRLHEMLRAIEGVNPNPTGSATTSTPPSGLKNHSS